MSEARRRFWRSAEQSLASLPQALAGLASGSHAGHAGGDTYSQRSSAADITDSEEFIRRERERVENMPVIELAAELWGKEQAERMCQERPEKERKAQTQEEA